MRVTIYRNINGRETIENIRYTDEIVEDMNMSDNDADRMDEELVRCGRYWLATDRFIVKCAEKS